MKTLKLVLILGVILLLCATAGFADQRERIGPPTVTGETDGPCVTVGTITSLPFNDNSVDSCTGVANISDYANGTCNSLLYPGPEVVYQINVGGGNSGLTMTLTPAAADLGIFLIGTCGNGPSCIAFNDAIGGGVASDIAQGNPPGADQIPNPLAAGSYFIYIDSYYAAGGPECGPFTLDITGTLPVELVNFSVD